MIQSLSIIEGSAESSEVGAGMVGSKRTKFRRLSKAFIGKIFSLKHFRANTVYVLLIASIFLTLSSAILTSTGINDKRTPGHRGVAFAGQNLPLLDKSRFHPVSFSSFILLTLTCSLALITIVKKDKSNAQLLSKLESANKQLEEKVAKRTSELAEAIRAKDHFLGIATHDLKSPLSGILGLVELIRLEKNDTSTRQAEYLGHIEYSCNKMQRLVHDILEINRIDQGKTIVRREKVDLASLTNELRRHFVQEAAKKRIQLIIDDIDGTIETDGDSLMRILENLLSNAIKFSPSMKNVWLNVRLEAERTRFEIVDEGPGIPLDEQPRLFNKFQRLSNRPTNSESSTGLGLSIVKELTSLLGGEITFKTEVRKGTTFIVRLPKYHQGCSSSNINQRGFKIVSLHHK